VVNVAKSQDHISSACGGDFSFVRRLEHGYHDLTINRAIALELLLEGLRALPSKDEVLQLTTQLITGSRERLSSQLRELLTITVLDNYKGYLCATLMDKEGNALPRTKD
jgi:hypothetical protein